MLSPFTSAVCGIYTVFIADSYVYYSHSPKGSCVTCCDIEEKDDIKFLLYTRKNLNYYQNLYVNDAKSLRNSNFDFNNPLVVYLHGFSDSATNKGQSSQKLKDAFLKAGDYNVILVDWSALTAAPWYINAVENIPEAADYMAKFIRYLVNQGYPVQKIHLIGFSLGAEAVGYMGEMLQNWCITLPRITGLDPAGPLFSFESSNQRLSSKVAQFVDVIHTDGDIFGNSDAVGHADFYPNGGTALQPGCIQEWLGLLSCSHQRAWEYFIETIGRPYAFAANSCETTKSFGTCRYANGMAYMGMGADKSLRGEFYLETNSRSPYGRNKK